MEYLQPYIYNVVKDVIKKRMDDAKFPYVAIQTEVMRIVREDIIASIRELEEDGVLGHSENVNGIYLYRVNKKLEDENDNVQ